MIVDNQHHVLAAPDPKGGKSQSRMTDIAEIIIPIVGVPDSIGLLPYGNGAAPQDFRLFAEQTGQRQHLFVLEFSVHRVLPHPRYARITSG